MITTILSDFSRVLLLPKDENFTGRLNDLNAELSGKGDFDPWEYFRLNDELINFLDEIKDKYRICIFTTGSVQNHPEIRARIDPIFKKIYSVLDIGLSKKDPKSYAYIAGDLKTKPEEIVFFDDIPGNIEAANKAGVNAVLFKTNDRLFLELTELLTK